MEKNTPDLTLCLYLNDSYNYQYEIKILFSKALVITAINQSIFPKKNYIGSFSLLDLKIKNKFFKMFESVPEAYYDFRSLSEQNSFFIHNQGNVVSLCIKKQIGIQKDIIFPLKEKKSEIKEIVTELCERNLNLEERVKNLETQISNLSSKIYDYEYLKNRVNDLENQMYRSKDRISDLEDKAIKNGDYEFSNLKKRVNDLENQMNKENNKISDFDLQIPFNLDMS